MRARRLAASAPASTSTEVASATPEAARIASASLAVSASIVSSASRTRTAATEGKSRAAAFISALFAAPVARQRRGDENRVGRALERVGGKDEDEIDGEASPVNLAQVGELSP